MTRLPRAVATRFTGLPITLAQIEKVNVTGGPLPASSGEETLDAQWTSGMAPSAAGQYVRGSPLRSACPAIAQPSQR